MYQLVLPLSSMLQSFCKTAVVTNTEFKSQQSATLL